MIDQEAVVGRANHVRDFTHESQVVAPKARLQPLVGMVRDCGRFKEHGPSKVLKQCDHIEAVRVDGIGTVGLVLKGVCCASRKSWRAECRVWGQERNVKM